VQINLKRRKVKTKTWCPMCKRLDEDCGHIFFKCKKARECWRELQMEEARCSLAQCKSGKEVAKKKVNEARSIAENHSVTVEMVDSEKQGKWGRKSAECRGGL
jgi:hypothetical protein